MTQKTNKNIDRQAEEKEALAWADPNKVEKHLGYSRADAYALAVKSEQAIEARRTANPVNSIEELFGEGTPEQNRQAGEQRLGRLTLVESGVVQIPVEYDEQPAVAVDVQHVA